MNYVPWEGRLKENMSSKVKKFVLFSLTLTVLFLGAFFMLRPHVIRGANIDKYRENQIVFSLPKPFFFASSLQKGKVVIFANKGHRAGKIGSIVGLPGDTVDNDFWQDTGSYLVNVKKEYYENIPKQYYLVSTSDEFWLVNENEVSRLIIF